MDYQFAASKINLGYDFRFRLNVPNSSRSSRTPGVVRVSMPVLNVLMKQESRFWEKLNSISQDIVTQGMVTVHASLQIHVTSIAPQLALEF